MTDLDRPLSSFPSRPLELDEINDLEDSDRIVSVIEDDETVDAVGADLFAYNCVLVTESTVSAAVYVDDDETWYRVYSEPRSEADLSVAYDAVREFRDQDGLFARAPLSVAEAEFEAERFGPNAEAEPDYQRGEEVDCPVCGDVHTVETYEDEYTAGIENLDASLLYVECPDARDGRLLLGVR